jgi:hypothetical protein
MNPLHTFRNGTRVHVESWFFTGPAIVARPAGSGFIVVPECGNARFLADVRELTLA